MHPLLAPIAWPLTTDRLTVRPVTAADAELVWRIRSQDVGHWLTSAPADRAVHREQFLGEASLQRTLLVERDGEAVGDLYLHLRDAWAQSEIADRAVATEAEIGWCLTPAHQGRGLATEAVGELLRLCFEELGLHRVIACCFADNEPSWRLMERLGMRREAHHVRDSLHRSGLWLDSYVYAMLEDEWAARRR